MARFSWGVTGILWTTDNRSAAGIGLRPATSQTPCPSLEEDRGEVRGGIHRLEAAGPDGSSARRFRLRPRKAVECGSCWMANNAGGRSPRGRPSGSGLFDLVIDFSVLFGCGALNLRPSGYEPDLRAAKPRRQSALRSSTDSNPTAIRIKFSPIPISWRSASVKRPCVDVAG